MVILAHSSYFSNFVKNSDLVPDYAKDYKNEYLFLRGINQKCQKFLMLLNNEEKVEGELFLCSTAKSLNLFFRRFYKAFELGYHKNLSDFYFKRTDLIFIQSLDNQIDDYLDFFHDPDSYEFDYKAYENDESGLREFYQSFRKFMDLIKIEEMTFEEFRESFRDIDSESD